MTAPCTDNYVVTCNPAPKTPASEVIVEHVTHTLATTGADMLTGFQIIGCVLIGLGVVAFAYDGWKRWRG